MTKPNLKSTKNTSLFITLLIFGLLFVCLGYFLSKKGFSKNVWISSSSFGVLLILFSIIVISGSPPQTPTSISVVDGVNQVTVSFTGSGGTYTVLSDPDGITSTGSSSPIVVSGLTNGKTYTFTLTASNIFGVSASSPPTNEVMPVPLPLTPLNIIAYPGNQVVSVSFTPNGSMATSFIVKSNPGGITSTGLSSPIVVTGLTNYTYYTFTVTGVDAAGSSAESSPTAPVAPCVPLVAPTSVVAIGSNTKASVSFTGSTGATSYIATSSPGGISGTGSSSPIVVSGLSNDVAYTFTVRAVNQFNSFAESSPSTPITQLDAPTSVIATGGNASASISFTGSVGATSYIVTSSDGITSAGSSSPIVVSGLTNGTTYTFTVRATNQFSWSSESPTIAVSKLDAPTSVVGTANGNTTASISFTGCVCATSYIVTSSPGGITATASYSPIVVSGLTNGTTYTFTVKAINSYTNIVSLSSSPSNQIIAEVGVGVDIIQNMSSEGLAYMNPGNSWVLKNITNKTLDMFVNFDHDNVASSSSFIPMNKYGMSGYQIIQQPGEIITIFWNLNANVSYVNWYGMGRTTSDYILNYFFNTINGRFPQSLALNNQTSYIQNQFTISGY